MAKELYRIEIPIETQDKYSDGLKKAEKDVRRFEKTTKDAGKGIESLGSSAKKSDGDVSKFQQTMRKAETQMKKFTSSRGAVVLKAVDNASRVITGVAAHANKLAGRTYNFTFRAVDMVTAPLRGIVRAATSTLGLLGMAGGAAGGIVMPLKMKMDRQSITTAFEVLLGSAEKADQRISELIDFAGMTPYARDEIFKASRLLEVFTKGALSTGKGLTMVGDIASGTQQGFEDVALWIGRMYDAMSSNRKIGEMTSRLQEMGAIDGQQRDRLEALAEMPIDIAEKWKIAEKEFQRFDGMMGKMSNNLANLLLGAKSFFMNNIVARWGDGLAKSITPALEKFRAWRKENSEGIKEMGNAVERYGERLSRFAISKAGGALGLLRKTFLPSKQEIQQMTQLEKYLSPEEAALLPKNMSFAAKVQFVIDAGADVFSDWWEKTGRAKVTGLGGRMGTAFGQTIRGAILGILGVEGKGASPFASAGMEAGSSFVTGFLDGLDAGDLAGKIAKKIAEINMRGVTDPLTGKGFGSTAGAFLVDALVLGALSKLLSPFKLLKSPAKWIGGAGKKGWGMFFGGGKGNDPESPLKNAPTNKPSNPKNSPPGPLSPRSERHGKRSFPKLPKMPEWMKKTPKLPKPPSWLAKLSKSRIPLIGTVLGGLAIGTASSEDRPAAIGSLTGGLAGAKAGALGGAAIGSVVPGIGTAVGGVAGGILGAIGGSTGGEWLAKNWGGVSSWLSDNVWEPTKANGANAINFVAGAFDIGKDKILENLSKIGLGSDIVGNMIKERLSSTWTGVQVVWSVASNWFEETVWSPVALGSGVAGAVINEKMTMGWYGITAVWGIASGWFQENVWNPISMGSEIAGAVIGERFTFARQAVQTAWGAASNWFEENVWGPLRVGVDAVASYLENKLDVLKTGASTVGNILLDKYNLAKDVAKGAANAVIDRGSKKTGIKSTPYANGGYINRPHLGLVGEAGPEMIIPLSSGRRNRAMDLYQRTGQMLGVRPYADGGYVGDPVPISTPGAATNAGAGKAAVTIQSVNAPIHIEINADSENLDTDGLLQRIKNEIWRDLDEGLREAFSNMPITWS